MAAEAELLERDRSLRELRTLLETARDGQGRVALVHGEAGIGKTALLRVFSQTPAARAVRLFWGGCDPLFTPRPLSPLLDIAWTHGGTLAERLEQGATRDDIFQAFFEELRRPRPPSLVVIEDVHWADEATLDLLKFLGRRIEKTSALLVVTWRDDELVPGHPVRSVLGEIPDGRRIRLEGLSAAAVDALGARAGRKVRGLHAATNGNPFFVTEALAAENGEVPPTVRDAVLSRAARLTAPGRALCELVSVVPSRVDLSVLSSAAGEGFDALDELVGRGMLLLADGAVAFRHDLARRAIEDALPTLRCRELHARIFSALASRPAEPTQLARLVHHAARAGRSADVLRLAPAAAEHAARLGAHREAAAHLAAALRFAADAPPERRAELYEARSYQCYLTDQILEGVEACAAARELWRELGNRAREGDCLRWLSRLTWYSGRTEEARRHAALAIAALEPLPPGRELAWAWSNQSQLHMLAHEQGEAIAWGEKALRLSRAGGYAEVEAHALNNLGCARIKSGDEGGWSLLEESLRLSLDRGLEEHAARAYLNLGILSVEERRNDTAERYLEAGVAYGSERDIGTLGLCALAWRARLRIERGRWVEAIADASSLLEDPGSAPVTRVAALHALGLARTRRGEPGASELLDEAQALARRNGDLERLVPVAAARAEQAWLAGDAAGARAEVEPILERATRAARPWFVDELSLWAWRGGGEPSASGPAVTPFGLQVRGDWRAAAAAFERIGCPYHAALACYEGDDPSVLLRMLSVLERLEARPATARLRRRLSELGVRGVPRGPRSARRHHPSGLTAREQEVLAALALGLSNDEIGGRLFVSPKTVDHHVSSILAKLGVRSRGAAVAEARRVGLLGESQGASRE